MLEFCSGPLQRIRRPVLLVSGLLNTAGGLSLLGLAHTKGYTVNGLDHLRYYVILSGLLALSLGVLCLLGAGPCTHRPCLLMASQAVALVTMIMLAMMAVGAGICLRDDVTKKRSVAELVLGVGLALCDVTMFVIALRLSDGEVFEYSVVLPEHREDSILNVTHRAPRSRTASCSSHMVTN